MRRRVKTYEREYRTMVRPLVLLDDAGLAETDVDILQPGDRRILEADRREHERDPRERERKIAEFLVRSGLFRDIDAALADEPVLGSIKREGIAPTIDYKGPSSRNSPCR